MSSNTGYLSSEFPAASLALEQFGLKFSDGGAHISRTMMLAELDLVLTAVPAGAKAAEYRDAILCRNALGKTTDSTREKSLRHLRELYALDDTTAIWGLLRFLHARDHASLPILALQVAWASSTRRLCRLRGAGRRAGYSPSRRAITRRCTSLVPSPISRIFWSR